MTAIARSVSLRGGGEIGGYFENRAFQPLLRRVELAVRMREVAELERREIAGQRDHAQIEALGNEFATWSGSTIMCWVDWSTPTAEM